MTPNETDQVIETQSAERLERKRRVGPSEAEVLKAIDETGFLLEQEVSSELESLGYNVLPNAAYEDIDEGTSREIDVVAIKPFLRDEQERLTVTLEIIGECKSTTNPYVFIGRARRPGGPFVDPPEFVFPLSNYRIPAASPPNAFHMVSGFYRFGLADVHYYHGLLTRTVQFCRLLQKNKSWQVDQGGVYDSIVYPLAKAVLARRARWLPPQGYKRSPQDWIQIGMLVPLVVSAGELFYVDTSLSSPHAERVTHATYERELMAKNIRGRFTIDFVSRTGLRDFVTQQLEPFVERVVALAQHEKVALIDSGMPGVH